MGILREAKERMALYYLKHENVFIDGEGEVVFEIFEIITPNDLCLFKKYKEDMLFTHRTEKDILVELYWPEENWGTMDVGDDPERIRRYEEAKMTGCFNM